MKPIEFLELDDVLQIHVDQISRYGGTTEIRSPELPESAIEQPRSTFAGSFLHEFPFEMATAYLFHLVMNHPFVDGNKRTETVAALVFLDWHGIAFEARSRELSDLTLAVTSSTIGKREVAEFFQARCTR